MTRGQWGHVVYTGEKRLLMGTRWLEEVKAVQTTVRAPMTRGPAMLACSASWWAELATCPQASVISTNCGWSQGH